MEPTKAADNGSNHIRRARRNQAPDVSAHFLDFRDCVVVLMPLRDGIAPQRGGEHDPQNMDKDGPSLERLNYSKDRDKVYDCWNSILESLANPLNSHSGRVQSQMASRCCRSNPCRMSGETQVVFALCYATIRKLE